MGDGRWEMGDGRWKRDGSEIVAELVPPSTSGKILPIEFDTI
jgi:hypothetical protein